jgi:hypothetical protein
LVHERTALVFPKEGASICAAHVLRLIRERSLFERLRREGRNVVEEYFEMGRLLDDLQRSLQGTVGGRGAGGFS